MTVTVWVWNMGSRGPDGEPGIGHAAMFVSGSHGAIYVSFWPSEHNAVAAWSSPGKVHFVNGDKLWDGNPHWISKPLEGMNEQAIIHWWSRIQHDPLIDYSRKKPFQLEKKDKYAAFQAASNAQYRILNTQCSGMVVAALMVGANSTYKTKIKSWFNHHGINVGPIELAGPLVGVLKLLGLTTPTDVKRLVVDVWHDADY